MTSTEQSTCVNYWEDPWEAEMDANFQAMSPEQHQLVKDNGKLDSGIKDAIRIVRGNYETLVEIGIEAGKAEAIAKRQIRYLAMNITPE